MFAVALKDMTDARSANHWKGKLNSSGGTGGGNVITGYISDTGQKSTRTYPCHNPIHQFKNACILWSAFGYRTDRNVASFYHSWLINDSPWARSGIVPTNSSPKEMFETGFVFENLDKTSANLLHNFLIATRMNAEWPALISAWFRLVTEYDIKPAFAFAMLTVFPVYKNAESPTKTFLDTDSCLANSDKYDWPLDMGRATEEYLLNFCLNKPVGKSNFMFYPLALTAPVNTLWGNLVAVNDPKSYVSTLKHLYGHLSKSTKIKSGFADLNGDYKSYDVNIFRPEDVLNIIQLEQKRLFK